MKKNQVEKHYQTQCRSCSVLSCIDCGIDFPGDAYKNHTSCISEAEKYQGHLYQPKDRENKGDAKQKQWLKQVQGSTNNVEDPRLKGLLEKISEYSNVPRKKKKFENFCKNSVKVYDAKTLDKLWEAFNGGPTTNGTTTTDNINEKEDENIVKTVKKKKRKHIEDEETNTEEEAKKKKKKRKKENHNDENDTPEEADSSSWQLKGKFHWHKAIKRILKESDDHELPLKKLRKRVVAAYLEEGPDHRAATLEESKALFEKKLRTYPKVKIRKEIVKLVK